ncbi:unnamed protein product [Kluyveromyces dobzhanskii CBS 2104]|uniref:WGS project CCBQ000000000 data, contig 00009 n=1 Tax=Kluyveromyces dobzhanskii CBS 2104 TaxID=1427455 RepID=A0A0A8L543_9SACH|nr:unnamed protein product [Kluyveromyces dobzhanskii CBS 2104]
MSPDNDLVPPKSWHPHAIAEWFHDPENVGGFVFLCFALAILLTAAVSLVFAIYYFFFHPPLEPEPAPKSIWISITDYQDKLTPEQQQQYIERACKQYEEEMDRLRLEQQNRESGVMFPKPIHKHTLFSKIAHFFCPRCVCSLEEIHRNVSECYFVDDFDSIEQAEKEVNEVCFPHNMV